jgi:hypothetical protein
VDDNGDGRISKNEFVALLLGNKWLFFYYGLLSVIINIMFITAGIIVQRPHGNGSDGESSKYYGGSRGN